MQSFLARDWLAREQRLIQLTNASACDIFFRFVRVSGNGNGSPGGRAYTRAARLRPLLSSGQVAAGKIKEPSGS
jgi:hypothetical protein